MQIPALPNTKRQNISPYHLLQLYLDEKKSVAEIAKIYGCSQNKINYWIEKFEIPKRTISEAIYNLKNPKGDPFKFTQPINKEQAELFGLGLGLYWGEGTKRGKGGMRMTNTDAKMHRKFIEFLETFFKIDRNKLRFSLQIRDDVDIGFAMEYWIKNLDVRRKQFYKTLVQKSRGKGTYNYKSRYGVVIMQFNNVKLKKAICDLIENIH